MATNRPAPYVIPRRAKANQGMDAIRAPKDIKFGLLPRAAVPACLITGRLANQSEGNALILSCLYYVLPLSSATLKKLFRVQPDKTLERDQISVAVQDVNAVTPERQDLYMMIAAYAAITHLAKEITSDNVSYVHSRLVAMGHDCGNVSLKNLDANTVAAIISIPGYARYKSHIEMQDATVDLLQDALTIDIGNSQLKKALVSSFEIVLRGYGMTAAAQMHYFTGLATRAHLYTVVLEECEAYRKVYEDFKANNPETWEFARILPIPGAELLNNSKYPHLYTCAIARANNPTSGGGNLGRYKKSIFQLNEAPAILERMAVLAITAQAQVTQDVADRIKRLNGLDVTSQVGQSLPNIV